MGGIALAASARGASTQTHEASCSPSSSAAAWRSPSAAHERWRNSTAARAGLRRVRMRPSSSRWAGPDDDVGRQLHQDGAQLGAERAGGLHQRVDDRVAQLAAGAADAPALVELGRQLAQRRRQAARLARVPGDDLVGLDVEAEVVGGALGPGRRGLEGGERVEGRVDLHHREVVGVVPQPPGGVVLHVGGVPPGLDELRVGPGGRAHADPVPHRPHSSRPAGRAPPAR